LTLLSFSKPTKIAQKWDSLDLYLTVVRTHTHTHIHREREREREGGWAVWIDVRVVSLYVLYNMFPILFGVSSSSKN